MRVLQISHKPPFPPKDGGCLAIKNVSCGLVKAGIELDVLTIETDKHPFKQSDIPKEYRDKMTVQSVHVDTSLNMVDAFASLVTSDSYNISRFFTPDVDLRLTEILNKNKYDIVHLESLFVTPYIGTIRRLSKAKIILRSHNLEYMIWERLALQAGNIAKKTYLKVLAKQLKRYEIATINDVDGIVSISYEDAGKYRKLDKKIPIMNLPFGIDVDDYSPTKKIAEKRFFHLGSLEWKPNLEGIQWFLSEVWPAYYKQHPDSKFVLAGRDIPESIVSKPEIGLDVVGEVENARKFMKENGVMTVPLRAAGGIRVKIIEGMALGVPVISTSMGAEGIKYNRGKNILIGDTPEEFIEQMAKCSPKVNKELAENGKFLMELEHNNARLIDNLVAFYKEILTK